MTWPKLALFGCGQARSGLTLRWHTPQRQRSRSKISRGLNRSALDPRRRARRTWWTERIHCPRLIRSALKARRHVNFRHVVAPLARRATKRSPQYWQVQILMALRGVWTLGPLLRYSGCSARNRTALCRARSRLHASQYRRRAGTSMSQMRHVRWAMSATSYPGGRQSPGDLARSSGLSVFEAG